MVCWSSLSFSACGLHFFYQLGVAKALLDHGVEARRVYCSSAGAAVALYFLLDLRHEIDLENLLNALPSGSRRRAAMFSALDRCCKPPRGIELARINFMNILEEILQRHPDAYLHVSGRLYIYVTSWPWMTSRFICQWSSNADLMCCLRATTCIPGVDTKFKAVTYRGECFVDGGFMSRHPVKDCHTVCVSTQLITQWWSKAYHVKDCPRPEIGRPLCDGSLKVKKKPFYRKIYEYGLRDAVCYLERRYGAIETVH